MKIAIIGAGWAGMAAAVEATTAGHRVSVFESSQTLGGRARAVRAHLPNGSPVTLDNGQHVLIGAYRDTLRLMRQVGVDEHRALMRLPLTLRFPDGAGLRLPDWPTPLDALAGILGARGWSMAEKWSLLRQAANWQRQGFQCDAKLTVLQLCQGLPPRLMTELLEPLCLSALNTGVEYASAPVFLRVLKDALLGGSGSSMLLLPRVDMSALFPEAAAQWLQQHGTAVHMGQRIDTLQADGRQWNVDRNRYDAVILATSASAAIRLLENSSQDDSAPWSGQIRLWNEVARTLCFEAIGTVYAWGASAALAHPMLALRSADEGESQAPAQFVFDRGQLGGPHGLLAFVASANSVPREALQEQVLKQAQTQLGMALQAVQTIDEKRATFACTPGLLRPSQVIAQGLLASGDYIAGPYPATIEGAVRSAVSAARLASVAAYDGAANARSNETSR